MLDTFTLTEMIKPRYNPVNLQSFLADVLLATL